MAYKVVIMPPAKEQLDMYIGYTIRVFKIKQAAKAIRDDARRTKKKLSMVVVDAMYHELQDYEGVFIGKMNLN